MIPLHFLYWEGQNMDIFEACKSYESRIAYQKKVIDSNKRIAIKGSEAGVSNEIMKTLLQDVQKSEAKLTEMELENIRNVSDLKDLLDQNIHDERIRYILQLKYILKFNNEQIADEVGLSCSYVGKLITKGKNMVLKG